MCGSKGGGGGGGGGSWSGPPGKSQVIWDSIEISIWTPPPGKSWTPRSEILRAMFGPLQIFWGPFEIFEGHILPLVTINLVV